MTFLPDHPIVAAAIALALGLLLILFGKRLRLRRGLSDARTVDLDRQTLISRRYGLVGRPDRLVQADGFIIPEEWKSSLKPRPSHRVQLGVYFLLVEEHYGRRPPHGFIVCGDGSRHLVQNDDALRSLVLSLAEELRLARRNLHAPITVNPSPGQCRSCGMRVHCSQAKA